MAFLILPLLPYLRRPFTKTGGCGDLKVKLKQVRFSPGNFLNVIKT
ncbi:MAG TPA: hypothetical protein VM871_09010 [Flavisolibacter sp.]|nr:hypothetical protein [Flavisolibacter sp.]